MTLRERNWSGSRSKEGGVGVMTLNRPRRSTPSANRHAAANASAPEQIRIEPGSSGAWILAASGEGLLRGEPDLKTCATAEYEAGTVHDPWAC